MLRLLQDTDTAAVRTEKADTTVARAAADSRTNAMGSFILRERNELEFMTEVRHRLVFPSFVKMTATTDRRVGYEDESISCYLQ